MSAPRRHREDEAVRDLSRTEVSRPVAAALVAAFVGACGVGGISAVIGAPDALPAVIRAPGPALAAGRLADASAALAGAMRRAEAALEDGSPVAAAVRPLVQAGITGLLGEGNAQVHVGRNDWLYYRPSLASVTTPVDPGAVPEILAFHDDLRWAGIRLVVVPVPAKPSVDGGGLALGQGRKPVEWDDVVDGLRRHGVVVVDALAELRAMPAPRYLRTDTHWRPEAMDRIAEVTAAALTDLGVPYERRSRRTEVSVVGQGDLAALLDPAGPERTDEVTVLQPRRRRPVGDPPVVLIGDSFAAMYDDPALGFGEGAGFATALEHHAGVRIDALVQHAGGATGVRRALASEPGRLADTLAVVWVFAARELAQGEWVPTPLDLTAAPVSSLRVVRAGGRIEGPVVAVSAPPDPRRAAYASQLVSIRLDVGDRAAFVYTWGMVDRALTPAAAWRVGEHLTMDVVPWSQAPPEARSAARTDVERPPGAPILWAEAP